MTSLPQASRTTRSDQAVTGQSAAPGHGDTGTLIHDCIPLVHHHVRSVLARVPSHVDRDELISAGMYALATCATKYDPSVGTSFAQFASTRIRGALLDELRSMDWATRSVRRKARDVAATTDQLSQALCRSATAGEIAEEMGISVRELSAIRADAQRGEVVSLQGMSAAESETLPADHAEPDEAVLLGEQLGELRDAIGQLPERLRTVVEQYFFAQRKMADIAGDLGVTESRVSQLRSQALLHLRKLMSAGPSDEPGRVAGARTHSRNNTARAPQVQPPTRPARARTLIPVGGTLVARVERVAAAKPLAEPQDLALAVR
jgi:RNA polymerase sigma factor FliA